MKAKVSKYYGYWRVSWNPVYAGSFIVRFPSSMVFKTWQEAIDYAVAEADRRSLKLA